MELFVPLCADTGVVGRVPYREFAGSGWVLCSGRFGVGAACSVSELPNNKEHILKNPNNKKTYFEEIREDRINMEDRINILLDHLACGHL